MKNPFKKSESKRTKILKEQKSKIKKEYDSISKDLKKDVETLSKLKTSSSTEKVYLNQIKMELESAYDSIDKNTEGIIKNGVNEMISSMVYDNQRFIYSMGFESFRQDLNIMGRMSNIVFGGKLYDGKWNLSKAIWGDNQKRLNEINKIISQGIRNNRPVSEIAKNLSRYVNPNARKNSTWYSKTGTRTDIDYNAQRLARTMVQHAYQESLVELTKYNPFIYGYLWKTSGGHNVCPLCIDRSTQNEYGLGPGVFPKDQLPLDHPNGMCTFEPLSRYTDGEIHKYVSDWYFDSGNKTMNKRIDKFIKSLE